MSKACVFILCAALVACDTGSKPPAASATSPSPAAATVAAPVPETASNTSVPQKLADLSGSGAADCGQVKSLAGPDVQKASDCAMASAKAKKPFHVEYDMPGLAVGVAGNSSGKLFAVQSEVDNGKPTDPKVTDCPAELRIAQSGRVTCMPPNSMGAMPGSANPHATSGASPHGGMSLPPAGTPNPHADSAAPKKSH